MICVCGGIVEGKRTPACKYVTENDNKREKNIQQNTDDGVWVNTACLFITESLSM